MLDVHVKFSNSDSVIKDCNFYLNTDVSKKDGCINFYLTFSNKQYKKTTIEAYVKRFESEFVNNLTKLI
jgi:hypothetical protein